MAFEPFINNAGDEKDNFFILKIKRMANDYVYMPYTVTL